MVCCTRASNAVASAVRVATDALICVTQPAHSGSCAIASRIGRTSPDTVPTYWLTPVVYWVTPSA